jgi:membrane associated rhomboid family serine protease
LFLPLRDLNPTERFPFVTIGLIALNVIVFLYELALGSRLGSFIAAYGAVPYEITHFADLVGTDPDTAIVHFPGPPIPQLTLFSSMFIHGGFLHIIGNMLYLWIFGNNIEDILGPGKFLLFYLVCGLAAAFGQIIPSPNSTVPMVGASGAVAGVLGAYLIAYPHARVLTLVFLFFFIRVMMIPAGVLLVFWFVIQAFSGVASLGAGGGGVAWFAHIGGFIAGVVLIKIMAGQRLARRRNRNDGDWLE